MKTFRSTEQVAADTVATAIAALRSRGLRVSTSRRMVLQALSAADEPLSADRIAGGVDGRMPPLDVASVYRNLETLEDLGVVAHFHAGHGPAQYVLAAGREYLACDSCGAVVAVEPSTFDRVRAALREDAGWTAQFSHFALVGKCPACAASDGAGSGVAR